jgi:hypothetical protein
MVAAAAQGEPDILPGIFASTNYIVPSNQGDRDGLSGISKHVESSNQGEAHTLSGNMPEHVAANSEAEDYKVG